MDEDDEVVEYVRHAFDLRPGWTEYFMRIAEAVALRGDCRRRKVGAVITTMDNRILTTGYNGSYPGGPSCLKGECPRGLKTPEELAHLTPDYSDCIALHAEVNAIGWAARSGVSVEGGIIYVYPCDPCNGCLKVIRAAGIIEVVWGSGATVETLLL